MDLNKHKVLTDLEIVKLSSHKWTYDRSNIESRLNIDIPFYITRKTNICSPTDRCHICRIYASSINNHLSKLKVQVPNLGRPLEQSPIILLCSKCGKSTNVHDDDFCKRVMNVHNILNRPENSSQREESRGYTENFTANFLTNTLEESANGNIIITRIHISNLEEFFAKKEPAFQQGNKRSMG